MDFSGAGAPRPALAMSPTFISGYCRQGNCWRGNPLQFLAARGALGATNIAIARGQLAVHVHVQPTSGHDPTSGHECLPTSGRRWVEEGNGFLNPAQFLLLLRICPYHLIMTWGRERKGKAAAAGARGARRRGMAATWPSWRAAQPRFKKSILFIYFGHKYNYFHNNNI